MTIRGDNTVLQSKIFNVFFPEDMKLAFNWIYHLLLCACKLGPSTGPVRSEKQKEEPGRFEVRLYTQEEEEDFDLEVDLGDGMEVEELY